MANQIYYKFIECSDVYSSYLAGLDEREEKNGNQMATRCSLVKHDFVFVLY